MYKPTISDLKVLVGFKKKKGDDAMPKQPKKKDWLDRYNKTKGRPTPNVSLAESDEEDASQEVGVALEAAEASTEESTNDNGEVVIRRTRRHERVDLCEITTEMAATTTTPLRMRTPPTTTAITR
ncbi:hypothetical protein THAOC_29418, partial [Thalassiosira oceanica]